MSERWGRGPEVLWRRSLDAVLVFGPAADGPLTLAGTGAELWDLLGEPSTVEDLVAALAARHAVDPATVENDIVPVLAELAERGVLAVVSG